MKYRVLLDGEPLQEGDEYFSMDEWHRSNWKESGVVGGDRAAKAQYRRPIRRKRVRTATNKRVSARRLKRTRPASSR